MRWLAMTIGIVLAVGASFPAIGEEGDELARM
jgi:hypothetical protein